MDATTRRLVEYALGQEFSALPHSAVHECKRRVIDSIGCAIGAYGESVSAMARGYAGRIQGDPGARIWGGNAVSSVEGAAFANGVMVRVLDLSDTYLGKSRGHPSDMISALLAIGEATQADGRDIITAVVLAYDVYCSLCDAVDWNGKGWDQPVYAVLGAVVGAGRLLRLSAEQLGHAVALAVVPNMALAQTRRGPLSSWKGCAGANAARNAVFAALLARDGFTGPSAIFEGEGGVFESVGRFDWRLPEGESMIAQTHVKSLPVCYHGQSAVLAALDLRRRVAPAEIEEVRVDTYRTAVGMMAGDPSRWAPTTHETADHSLPYTVGLAFLDGEVTQDSFAVEKMRAPDMLAFMRKVHVHEDLALSAHYPEGSPARVTVTTSSGGKYCAEMLYPTGHARNPMSDQEIASKFLGLLRKHPCAARGEALLDRLLKLEAARDVGRDVLALLTPTQAGDAPPA